MTQRPFVLGLTGSIGMGKSTTAAMFRDAGVPVWDADGVVHDLYARGGAGVAAVARLCPDAVCDGRVDRVRLRAAIAQDPSLLDRLELGVHPLVAKSRQSFLADAEKRGETLVVLDIPLLFEKRHDGEMDAILVVSAPQALQRARVLERGSMDATQFAQILARQMPDAEKRARADHVIETRSLDQTRSDVARLIATLKQRP